MVQACNEEELIFSSGKSEGENLASKVLCARADRDRDESSDYHCQEILDSDVCPLQLEPR